MQQKRKTLPVWVKIMVLGAVTTGAAFLPFLNPPQCPNSYTQTQIDASNCIVGVNMGAATIWMLGVLILTVGGLVLLVEVLEYLFKILKTKFSSKN